MEENENKDINQQSIDTQIQQAAINSSQLAAIMDYVLKMGVESKAGVYPSIYRDRERRIAESSQFASKKELDYTDYKGYLDGIDATKEGGIASDYVFKNPSLIAQFNAFSNMFEQRAYDISDANAMMNLLNITPEDKELFADYIDLMSGNSNNKKYKEYFDMLNVAKTFTTPEQRYNREDNDEISFIIDSGTTANGLLTYWKSQLNGMGFNCDITPDEYVKVGIPINKLSSAPYFAYAFIESYNNDYTNPSEIYDEVKGNYKSNTSYLDSRFHRNFNRNQLISINNVTNDRDGGSWSFYADVFDVAFDLITKNTIFNKGGAGSILGNILGVEDTSLGYKGYLEYDKLKRKTGLSQKELDEFIGISKDEYYKQRNDLAYKYDDGYIIDIMKPVHATIKQYVQRMGLPQNEVVTGIILPMATLEEGKLDEAQVKGDQKATELTPLRQNIAQIPHLLANATINPNEHIGIRSVRDSNLKVYNKLDPALYEDVQEKLRQALAHGKVDMKAEVIPSATDSSGMMYITLDFDVISEKKDDINSAKSRLVDSGYYSYSVKPGTDRLSIRFPASIIGGPETDAADSPVNKYKNQIEYLRDNGRGGQVTLLNDFIPQSLPLTLEFTGKKEVPIRLKGGIRNINTGEESNRQFEINETQFDKLAQSMYLMKGLRSKLYMTRYLKDVYGEDNEHFLKSKDEFETQYGEAMATLAITLFEQDYMNGESIYDLINDVKYTFGFMDENGNEYDLFDTESILNYEKVKRNKKK